MLHEGRLRMTRGDYGIPLILHIIEHCKECLDDLEPSDVVRAEILKNGIAVYTKENSLEDLEATDGMMEIYLTPQEAEGIDLGLYAFRVNLIREGQIHNTLLSSILEVIP